LVLLILAVIWAAVLLPPYLQNRSESRPADSISSFQRQLSVLERRAGTINERPRSASRAARHPADEVLYRAPAPAVAPAAALRMSRIDAKRRRREVLFTLAGAASITFVLAVLLGGPVWGLNLLCDIALGAYVVLLVQTQKLAAERTAKVRYLPNRSRQPEPALLLRRSGS
jgi:hypothetical protein